MPTKKTKKAANRTASSKAKKATPPRKGRPTLKFYFTDEAIKVGIDPPYRAHDDDAGIDLRALHDVELPPQAITQVPTGVGFELPKSHYGLICNRTSRGHQGILPMGHVVDCGYTGELILILYNANPAEPILIKSNERIAQMVVMPYHETELRQVKLSQIAQSERGAKRLGSSGK